MNLNSHYPASHEMAPTMIHSSGGQALHHIPQHPSPPTSKRASPLPPLTDFLPPLLKQASKGGFGLSKIPQKTLHDNLQPVIRALEHLDAEALLDLATIKSNAPGCGPKVRNGYVSLWQDYIETRVRMHLIQSAFLIVFLCSTCFA